MGCVSASLVSLLRPRLVPIFLGTMALATPLGGLTAASDCGPTLVSPEVRRLVAGGPTRVLVELCLAAQPGVAGPPVEAIATAQDALLSRLPGTGVSLVRRYRTIPWLALELDAGGLAVLEAMGDLVARVSLDSTVRPSGGGSRLVPSQRGASAHEAAWVGQPRTISRWPDNFRQP
jgi:hypothetical protein